MNSTLIDKAKKTPWESETPLTKEEIEVRNTIKKEILKTFEKKWIILPEWFEIDDQFLDAIIEAHNYNPNQEELWGFSPEVITKKALILKQYIDNYNKEIDEYNKSNLDNPKKKLDGSVIRCLMEGGYCGAVEPNEFINYIYHGLKIGDKIYTKWTWTIRTVLSIDKWVVTCEVNRNGFMTIEQLEKRRLANDVHLIEKIESAPNVAMNAMIENQTQSQINFNNYFEWNIAQWDISNCFQVATMRWFLNAASKNPRIKQLITDNLKELDDKRQVRIPIWSGPWIDVIKEDFKRKNNWIVWLFKKFGIDRIDQIDWPIWYKILETAIIKSLNSQIVWRLQTGRIGESWRALVNRGASPTIILETLFPTAFIKKLGAYDERPLSQVDYGAAYQLLTNFDPYNDIMTLGSLVWGSDSESYYVNGVKIYRSHAYTVVSVVNNMVTLENPMDTRTKIQLPLHDVINNFIGIRSITIP